MAAGPSKRETILALSASEGGLATVQRIAAYVVGRVLGGKNLDRELLDVLSKSKVSSNERGAIHSISFDTLRHYGLISAQLDTLLTAPLNDAEVRHLLLVSLAQLQFSKVPSHTVVDCAVNAVELAGFARAKGLTNAVLRNYLRAPEKFKRERFKDAVAKYDFPRWWIDRLQAEAPTEWERVLLSSLLRPPMHLRVNVRKTTVDNVLAALAAKSISATRQFDAGITLDAPLPVSEIPGFAEGEVSVQDIGAQLSAHFLDAKPGMRVLDACAAPGGKAAHLLERADVNLTALDDDRLRLSRVEDNFRRLGLQDLKPTLRVVDASALDRWWDKVPFDRILLDVPCSGSGVTRRHPDIKWIRRETDLNSFARVQQALLVGTWNALAKGGRLLYVTCSVFAAENEEVVSQFLATHKDAARLPLTPPENCGVVFAKANTVESAVTGTIYPTDWHDGFFYALIEKR